MPGVGSVFCFLLMVTDLEDPRKSFPSSEGSAEPLVCGSELSKGLGTGTSKDFRNQG